MEKCKVEGCNSKVKTRGYCHKHYLQIWRHGKILEPKPVKLCKVEGCNNVHLAKGYCNKHWQQMSKYGRIRERTSRDPNEFIIEGDICRIKLYNEHNIEVAEAIIDAEDYKLCKDRKWRRDRRYRTDRAAAVTTGNTKTGVLYLHHIIMGRKDTIDHKDGNTLNNRKSNLRFCNTRENNRNSKLPKNNTSGYKGVSWNKNIRKWTADIMVNYKHIYLGSFNNRIDAAMAYNEAALKYFGEYAKVNDL